MHGKKPPSLSLPMQSSLALSPEFVSSVNQSDPARRTDSSDGVAPAAAKRRKAANRRARDRCKGRDERGIKYREERRGRGACE